MDAWAYLFEARSGEACKGCQRTGKPWRGADRMGAVWLETPRRDSILAGCCLRLPIDYLVGLPNLIRKAQPCLVYLLPLKVR